MDDVLAVSKTVKVEPPRALVNFSVSGPLKSSTFPTVREVLFLVGGGIMGCGFQLHKSGSQRGAANGYLALFFFFFPLLLPAFCI